MSSTIVLRLQQQLQTVEKLENELKHLNERKISWQFVMKQCLLRIRDEIEDCQNQQEKLKNDNLILKNKIHHLQQEEDELIKKRIKSSKIKFKAIKIPKAMMFNIKPPSPLPNVIEPMDAIPSSFIYEKWNFESLKRPMADSNEIDKISKNLDIKTLPEMIFSNSYLKLSFPNSIEINFNAINGLRPCKGIPSKNEQVEVQYASEWKNNRKQNDDVEHLKFNYDWTYTTNYCGDYKSLNKIDYNVTDRFNMDLLTDTSSPILWSCHLILYEDELSDNGMSQLLIRCRIMPKCFLILCRYWLRVDNVIIRINDTRIFHQFGRKFLLKHVQQRESKWNKLLKKYPNSHLSQFTDPNIFSNKIDIKHSVYDKIYL